MASEIHVGDVGTAFTATVKDEEEAVVDLSDADVLQLWFLKPDQTTLTKTATLVTDGTDGKIRYTTQNGDLDQPGNWKVQAYVEYNGNKLHSDITRFKVHANVQ